MKIQNKNHQIPQQVMLFGTANPLHMLQFLSSVAIFLIKPFD